MVGRRPLVARAAEIAVHEEAPVSLPLTKELKGAPVNRHRLTKHHPSSSPRRLTVPP